MDHAGPGRRTVGSRTRLPHRGEASGGVRPSPVTRCIVLAPPGPPVDVARCRSVGRGWPGYVGCRSRAAAGYLARRQRQRAVPGGHRSARPGTTRDRDRGSHGGSL